MMVPSVWTCKEMHSSRKEFRLIGSIKIWLLAEKMPDLA